MITLQELKTQVEELAKKIDAPTKFFPTFGMSRHDGTPNVEISGNTYYYLAYDRDAVCTNRRTTRLPKLLYWIFEDITLQMGVEYVRTHGIEKPNDYHSVVIQHQLELLETLHTQWRELREQEREDDQKRKTEG